MGSALYWKLISKSLFCVGYTENCLSRKNNGEQRFSVKKLKGILQHWTLSLGRGTSQDGFLHLSDRAYRHGFSWITGNYVSRECYVNHSKNKPVAQ